MAVFFVTGAAGFVGSRACAKWTEEGHQVIAAVRHRRSGTAFPRGVEILEVGDLAKTEWRSSWFAGVDAIIHLAARVHIMDEAGGGPLSEFRRVNVEATMRLVEASFGHIGRFVLVSSLHAVRTLCEEILDEQSECLPDSNYGISKLEAERELRRFASENDFDFCIVRPPAVYGPGTPGNLERLVEWIAQGRPVPVTPRGSRRSLIHVDNLVDALHEAATQTSARGETFMLDDGQPIELASLVRMLAQGCNRTPRLLEIPEFAAKFASNLPGIGNAFTRLTGSLAVDSTRIRTKLSWQPQTAMEFGLAQAARATLARRAA